MIQDLKIDKGINAIVFNSSQQLKDILSIFKNYGYTFPKHRPLKYDDLFIDKGYNTVRIFRNIKEIWVSTTKTILELTIGTVFTNAEDFIKLHKTQIMTPKEILINAIDDCAINRINGLEYKIVLVTTDTETYICIDKHTLQNIKCNGYNLLKYYNAQLVNICSEFNINAIYVVPMGIYYTDIKKYTPIWKRSKIKELTLEEIAKKFGVNVENIRIKD